MSLSDLTMTSPAVPHIAFSGDESLVQVQRGGLVESVHRGSIAVADESGNIIAGVGDVWERAFLRSGAKPFQVMPAVLTGAIERFGITGPELAVLCASHSGEPRHLEAVLSVLGKIGLDESALQCGVHPPINLRAAVHRWQEGLAPSPVCNNCSGAHAGMLLACVARGWSIGDYGHSSHPLQIEIRHVVRSFSGAEQGELEEAVDNCAVPTFRLPLVRSATAFARLASGRGVPDELAHAAGRVRDAMTSYPEMVAGENRLDSDLMRAAGGQLVAKGGAEGFAGIGSSDEAVALALKISDGSPLAATTAAVRALEDLDLLTPAMLEALDAYREPAVLNMCGEQVGRMLPTFHLRTCR